MKDVLQVFAAGIGGVFIGITLLYIAIRLTSVVADKLSKGGAHDN